MLSISTIDQSIYVHVSVLKFLIETSDHVYVQEKMGLKLVDDAWFITMCYQVTDNVLY